MPMYNMKRKYGTASDPLWRAVRKFKDVAF